MKSAIDLMDEPLVSIVIPSYRMGKFVRQALQSIGEQTYGNWEVILVDDCGPEDGTREALQEFQEKHPTRRVQYLSNEKNEGCGESRNVAMRAANGEYYAFLDPDDCWAPEYLVDGMLCMSSKDLCIQGVMITDEAGVDQGPRMENRMNDLIGAFPTSLMAENFLLPSATLIRRRVIMAVGEFKNREALIYAADWDFYLRCVAAGMRFGFLRKHNCRYRKHDEAATGNYLRMMGECVKVLRMNWKSSAGWMKKSLSASLHVHLCRLVYLKISHRDWSGLKELEEAFLLDPLNPDLPKSLIRALKNNWS